MRHGFRGFTAPASLKCRTDAAYCGIMMPSFPGLYRPGLIEVA